MFIIRRYINDDTGERTFSAKKAQKWLRTSHGVTLCDNGRKRWTIRLSMAQRQFIVKEPNHAPAYVMILEGVFCGTAAFQMQYDLNTERSPDDMQYHIIGAKTPYPGIKPKNISALLK